MIKKLILRLPYDGQNKIEWCGLDENGNVVRDVTIDGARDAEIIVLVPGCDVFLTAVNLPNLSRAQLTKAIPYALEDQLSEPITKLHFAIGKREHDNMLPVAVVSKKKLEEWAAQLNVFFHSKSHILHIMLPDTLTLPLVPRQWTIYITNNMALVRTGMQSGFATDLKELWIILELLLNQTNMVMPEAIIIMSNQAILEHYLSIFQKKNIPIQIKPATDFFELITKPVNSIGDFNLLQGRYRFISYYLKSFLAFNIPLILANISLLILAVGGLVQLIVLHDHNKKVQSQIVRQTKEIFPNRAFKDNKDIKYYLQKEIASLNAIHGGSTFLKILERIAPVIANTKGIQLMGLDYGANQITLNIESTDFGILDKLRQEVSLDQYQVTLNDAIKSGNHIKANLLIQEKNL